MDEWQKLYYGIYVLDLNGKVLESIAKMMNY